MARLVEAREAGFREQDGQGDSARWCEREDILASVFGGFTHVTSGHSQSRGDSQLLTGIFTGFVGALASVQQGASSRGFKSLQGSSTPESAKETLDKSLTDYYDPPDVNVMLLGLDDWDFKIHRAWSIQLIARGTSFCAVAKF